MARNNSDDNQVYREPMCTVVNLQGNLTRDPVDISRDEDGSVVAFDMASNYTTYNGDQGVRYFKVVCLRRATSKNFLRVATRGTPVVVTGELYGDEYEKDGEVFESLKVTATHVHADYARGAYDRLPREDDDEEDEKPRRGRRSSRSRDEDDEEETTSRRSRRSRPRDEDDDEEDEKPARRSRRSRGDDEDEKPARRSRSSRSDDDDEEDEKPRRRRSRVRSHGDDDED